MVMSCWRAGSLNTTWQTPGTSGRWPPVAIAWKIASYEDVTVPAGTFKAFRILITFTRQDRSQLENVLWYAPEARQFVKMDGATGFLKFQVAGLDRATTGPIQFALEGLPEKERLARAMQKACGVGGTVKDGQIEIQGDKREEVARILAEANFRPVFAGG